MKTKYFHTYISKYQDELDKHDVVIREDGRTDREDAFTRMKPELDKIFDFEGAFLLVEIDDYKKRPQKERRVFANHLNIEYQHDAYLSRIVISMFDVFRKKWVDVSMNCKAIKSYEAGVKFKEILEDIK
jgi:hypothetical protein